MITARRALKPLDDRRILTGDDAVPDARRPRALQVEDVFQRDWYAVQRHDLRPRSARGRPLQPCRRAASAHTRMKALSCGLRVSMACRHASTSCAEVTSRARSWRQVIDGPGAILPVHRSVRREVHASLVQVLPVTA